MVVFAKRWPAVWPRSGDFGLKKFLIVLLVVIGGVYLGYRWIFPEYHWSQKLLVTVKTPTGIKTGSSMTYVRWRGGPGLLPDPPNVTSTVHGEATVVDLGQGKYLFVLIKGAERLGLAVFGEHPLPQVAAGLIESIKMTEKSKGQTRDISPEFMPLMVTFDDINDPKTAKKVDPLALDAAFGPGYALESIFVSIGNDAATDGELASVVPWIGDRRVLDNPAWRSLSGFSQEVVQGLRKPVRRD